MKFFTRFVLLSVMLIVMMGQAHSETTKSIQFENQREEIFDLENFLKETRYKTETIDSTCYRREPYVENVCRDVTRYRQECRTIPGHQVCRTVNEPVCRTENRYENECHMERGESSCRVVVRYKQECSSTGGGRLCRTIPGDVVCRRAPNGENRCEKIPPREVCENTPGQQQCRQVPYEERVCTDGPSRQVCRQVNRPHQVCENRTRQQCDWNPDERVCSQIPYSTTECRDETLYRSIPYACKEDVKVPYEVTLKTHRANVMVEFSDKAIEGKPVYSVSLDEKGVLAFTGNSESQSILALLKKEIVVNSQADINTISAKYKVTHFDLRDLFNVNSKGISNIDLGKRSLSFIVNGKFDVQKTSLYVKIAKKDNVKFEKMLRSPQLKTTFDGSVTKVEIDLESLGAPKLGGVFNKTHSVLLKLKLDIPNQEGEIVIPKVNEVFVGANVETEAN